MFVLQLSRFKIVHHSKLPLTLANWIIKTPKVKVNCQFTATLLNFAYAKCNYINYIILKRNISRKTKKGKDQEIAEAYGILQSPRSTHLTVKMMQNTIKENSTQHSIQVYKIAYLKGFSMTVLLVFIWESH